MKRVLGCGAVGLLLVGLFLGLLAWAVWVHTVLTRAERSVDRAWTEFENAVWRRDEALVGLLETIRRDGTVDRVEIDRIDGARREASRLLPTPELATDEGRLAEFCRLQAELQTALRELDPESRPPEAWERLVTCRHRVAECRLRFDEAASRYNDALSRPPSSWMGRLAGFRPAARFEAVCGGGGAPFGTDQRL